MSNRRTTTTSIAQKAALVLNDHEDDLLDVQEETVVPTARAGRAGRRVPAQGAEEEDVAVVAPTPARGGRRAPGGAPAEEVVEEEQPAPVTARGRRGAAPKEPVEEDELVAEETPVPTRPTARSTRPAARTVVAPQEADEEADDTDLTRHNTRKAPRTTNAQKVVVEAPTKTARQTRVKIGGLSGTTKGAEPKFESVFEKNDHTAVYIAECSQNNFNEIRDEINGEIAAVNELFKKQPKVVAVASTDEVPVVPVKKGCAVKA